MILALLIYLAAHTGTVVATPVVINAVAVGAIATESHAYFRGRRDVEDGVRRDLTVTGR
jgi:hypothetical protein